MAGVCDLVTNTITSPSGAIQVHFAATKGTKFYIGIRFSTSEIVRHAAPSSGTLKFFFHTVGVPRSTSELDLVKS